MELLERGYWVKQRLDFRLNSCPGNTKTSLRNADPVPYDAVLRTTYYVCTYDNSKRKGRSETVSPGNRIYYSFKSEGVLVFGM